MRVVYSVGKLPDWIEVAKKLQQEYQWEPCYWLLTDSKEAVLSEFPDIHYHWFHLLNRGIDTNPKSKVNQIDVSLDSNVIQRFSKYEHSAFSLMDRMDYGFSFSYQDRQRLYYKLLLYWINIFKLIEPNILVFNISPHSIAEYILYAVGVEMGCRVAIFQTTSVSNLVYIRERLESQPDRLLRKYKEQLENRHAIGQGENDQIEKDVWQYLLKMKKDYSKAMPWFIKNRNNNNEKSLKFLLEIKNIAKSTYKQIKNFNDAFNKKKRDDIFVIRGHCVENRSNNILIFLKRHLHNFERRLKTYKLKKYYAGVSSINVDFNAKYIYVPLHFQPERTTLPEGGYYYNQYLMISMISNLIPSDWLIYVKEHQTQFMHFEGFNVRTKTFYEDIKSLKNVIILSAEIPTFDLIDNCKAVATVTGTAGWEGVCRGKPALVFGTAWYLGCKGSFAVGTAEKCKKAIDQIKNGYHIDDYETSAFLLSVEKIGARGYLTKSYRRGVGIAFNDNINSLFKSLCKYIYEL